MNTNNKHFCYPFVLSFIFYFLFFNFSFAQEKQDLIDKPVLPEEIQVQNMGPKINSKYNDYSFRMTLDGKYCVFTSNRETSTKKDDDDDLWFCTKLDLSWNEAENFGDILNIEGDEEYGGDGSPSITADGLTLYFASARSNGSGNVDIYSATNVKGKWTDIKNLGANLNSKYFDSHPAISLDGKTLYFASDRQGGYGGVDIWYSQLDNNGVWSEPKNCGPIINSSFNESSPCLAADGVTLYFSSDDPNGLGGYDIYKSLLTDKVWSKPENLRAPINSEYNERFPFVPPVGKIVYFSSDRKDGFGEFDIYVALPNPKPPKRVTKIVGIVSSAQTRQPLKGKVEFKDTELGKIVATIDSDDKTGDYAVIIPLGKKFEVTATSDGYISYKDNFEIPEENLYQEIKKDIRLSKIKAKVKISTFHILSTSEIAQRNPAFANFMGLVLEDVKITESLPLLNYIFFDKTSSEFPKRYKIFASASETEGFSESKITGYSLIQYYHVLNIIGERMKNKPASKITLVGCNDNDEDGKGNVELSRKRAETVRDYLVNIWSINKERIKVLAQNLPDLNSSTASSEGRAENMRVEIQSADWDIVKPVTFGQDEKIPSPNKVSLNINVTSEDPIKTWQLTLSQDGKVLKRFSENKSGKFVKDWDWKEEIGDIVSVAKPITYEAFAIGSERDTVYSEPVSIPVKIVDRRSKQIDKIKDREIEKISLILFDYASYSLSPQNQKVMKIVYDRIRPDSKIDIFGYTDAIGSADVNLTLSRNRAKAVYDEVKKTKIENEIDYEGLGKEKPLYNNILPEGRFYNRTVQIILERELK